MSGPQVLVVGGGPAGMMAGFLFARAGVQTLVIEKHRDFLRDFRGDTVHPSTLALFDELGLLDGLLARPHDRVPDVGAVVGGREYRVADFSHLSPRYGFIAMMPQWEFLNYLAERAHELPAFSLRTQCEATGLLREGGRITGCATRIGEPIRAGLTIAADGRSSVLRTAAGLEVEDLGAPIDVLWFRVPKARTPRNRTAGYIAGGEMIVTIDRGDYWQCARVIAKGGATAILGRGIEAFRQEVRAAAPALDRIDELAAIADVKLLGVSLDRLRRWDRPGLLAIGDAAHAMSPVGGVGINLAIQDAVAAANLLAASIARGDDPTRLLPLVRRRRMPAVATIQALQRAIHRRVIGPAMAGGVDRAPAILRLIDRVPLLQRGPARILGMGLRREHIRSPEAVGTNG